MWHVIGDHAWMVGNHMVLCMQIALQPHILFCSGCKQVPTSLKHQLPPQLVSSLTWRQRSARPVRSAAQAYR